MLKDRLTQMKDDILQYNTYFNNGFSDVYADEQGIREKEKVVFPADKLGDYFYIRLNNGARLTNTERDRMIDCTVAVGATMSGVLVACVKNANADMLVENLVNTLMWNGIIPTGAMWQKEEVIKQEMKVMGAKDLEAALKRVHKDYTIVSVSFEYRGAVYPVRLDCMQNPCKCSG